MKKLPGISERSGGRLGYVRVAGRLYRKQFSAGTPTAEIVAWHDEQRRLHGSDAPVEATSAAPAGSFAADVDEYLARVAAMVTIAERRASLYRWVAELGGDRDRNSITPAELDRVVQRWTVTPTRLVKGQRGGRASDPGGLAPGTIRQRLIDLRAFFTTMNGAGGVNPVRGCKAPSAPKPEARGLDYGLIAQILAAMPTRYNRRGGRAQSLAPLRAAVVAYTGLPPATIKRLRPLDLVRDALGVIVAVRLRPRRKGAGVEARTVPVTPQGAAALQAFDAAQAYGGFAVRSVNASFKRAAARLGVPLGTVRLYDLRHSFGTELYRQTRDLATVGRLMHHAPGSRLTERYLLGANDEVDRAAVAGFLAARPAPPAPVARRRTAASSRRKVPIIAKRNARS